MAQMMLGTLISIGSFLAILTLVVSIHELGHFWAARACGVAVDRFSLGFGKAIFSWTDKHGVEWRIGRIPIGGYVRFAGDSDASSSLPDGEDLADLRRQIVAKWGEAAVSQFFHFKPLWQRAIVVAAGPVANFILSIFILTALVSIEGMTLITPRLGEVVAQSPAARAGLQAGDLITALDGRHVESFPEISDYVRLRTGDPIRVDYVRQGAAGSVVVTPVRIARKDPVTQKVTYLGAFGVRPSRSPSDLHSVRLPPVRAFVYGVNETYNSVATTLTYLGRLITGRESPSQLSSIVGMAQTAGAVAKAGADSAPDLPGKISGVVLDLLYLAAMISTAIGFMNLLPVPVLDGGHLVFYAYEAIARRPVEARIQSASFRIGLALLLGLMLFATWNDLQQSSLFKLLGLAT